MKHESPRSCGQDRGASRGERELSVFFTRTGKRGRRTAGGAPAYNRPVDTVRGDPRRPIERVQPIPPSKSPVARGREILSVSELNGRVASLIESTLGPLWVGGEISNFVRAASGHCYFTLKDSGAQVRCVMFRSRARALGFDPREGDRVEVLAQASLYQARGDFQLGVEQMRQAGAGDLFREFMRLRARLEAEGLFDPERKRPIVPLPRAIGVVTSPAAAALRDVLTTLARRAAHVPVIVYPTPVQGVDAPAAIVAALGLANRRREVDVLLLVRGGGSIEDLWSFNDERVARAIHASELPVIAGVGHETDVTIADFVADARAPTPTGAAVLAATDRRELLEAIERKAAELIRCSRRRLRQSEQRLDMATRLLRPPSESQARRAHRLRELAGLLSNRQALRLGAAASRLARAESRLAQPPVAPAAARVEWLAGRLLRAGTQVLADGGRRVGTLAAQLELVSPEAVLERGYAIVRHVDGRVLQDAADAPPRTALSIRLARGELRARVEDGSPPRSAT